MTYYVADTHGLYCYLIDSPLLGANESAAFDEAGNGNAIIYIPSIVIDELYFLNTKHGEPIDFAVEFARLENSSQFEFVGFNAADVKYFTVDAGGTEMHDRYYRRPSPVAFPPDA